MNPGPADGAARDRLVRLGRGGMIVVFVAYWLATLLVVSHNNPLRIQLHGAVVRIARVLPQQWTFFSPPSPANRRIHFHYSTELHGEKPDMVLNALEPILKEKHARRPFNYPESKLDYILNHSCDLLAARVVTARELDRSLADNAALGEYMRSLAQQEPMPPELKTLLRYGVQVFQSHGQEVSLPKFVEVVISDVPIRRFKDRYAGQESESRINFRSGPVALRSIQGGQ